MYGRCDSWVEQPPAKEELIAELRNWERELVASSLDGERFFDKAFSSGKAVAACLAYAQEIGWREALDDLRQFRLTVLGPSREIEAPRVVPMPDRELTARS